MGYYIRVLGTQDPDKWTILQIANEKGEVLSQLERNPVIYGTLGMEELEEFREIILEFKPVSAVHWLTDFFEQVKVIYAFQLLNAAFKDSNFEIISNLKTKIWNTTKGILQADLEGFSNQEGFHILWQFADNVTGEWSCAVINHAGQWINFIMDIGDETQRIEFKNGEVPKNAKRL